MIETIGPFWGEELRPCTVRHETLPIGNARVLKATSTRLRQTAHLLTPSGSPEGSARLHARAGIAGYAAVVEHGLGAAVL